MDLRFTEQEEAFRREVRDFIRASLPANYSKKLRNGYRLSKEELKHWTGILYAKGWAVPHWPRAWGGADWSPIQQMIFKDEIQQAPAPETLSFGTAMVGPVILAFGSEAQKQRFLPRIATLQDWWCQGFSEPGAGSDLASLKTTARREGDVWVINGQKTWTTYAQYADWIFVLARTDMNAKKQAGISFLLVDMKTPGVTVRPIEMIDGGHEINEVFFDDVRIPLDHLVGEENKGWDYAKYLLTHERNGQARIGISKARMQRIREIASLPRSDGYRLFDDPRFRQKFVELNIEIEALEMTVLRVIASEANMESKPNPASSVLKIRGSEIQQATTELLMDAIGPQSLACRPLDHEVDDVDVALDVLAAQGAAETYFNMRKLSIYGGANEIQRTIIAKTILGL